VVHFVKGRRYQSYCSLIDSIVVASIIDPTLTATKELADGVERRGELTRGMTVVIERRAHHGRTDLARIHAVRSLQFDVSLTRRKRLWRPPTCMAERLRRVRAAAAGGGRYLLTSPVGEGSAVLTNC
jgi:hypothetical protein